MRLALSLVILSFTISLSAIATSAAPEDTATSVVRRTFDVARSAGPAQIRALETIDFDSIAKFVLTAVPPAAVTPQERVAMEQILRDIVGLRLQARAREDAATLQMLTAEKLAGGQIGVVTTIGRRRVVWRLRANAATSAILDMVVDGISLRAALRDEFSALVTRADGSVATAIQALRERYARQVR